MMMSMSMVVMMIVMHRDDDVLRFSLYHSLSSLSSSLSS